MPRPRRILATLLLAVCGLGALSSCAGSPLDAAGDAPMGATADAGAASSPEIRELLQQELAAAGVPGGAIAMVDRSGVTTIECVGDARVGEASVTPDTVFAYRSITKSFIGEVIIQLADEGRLRLDDSIADFVPGVPGGDTITIADLATMRSGLANYLDLEAVETAVAEHPEHASSVGWLLWQAFESSPLFAAGEAFHYSNTNTLLLGEVIRVVTGHAWFDEVRARVLQPLGLGSVRAGFTGGAAAAGYAVTFDGEVVEEPQIDAGWYAAAGALVGTVGDLARWGVHLGGATERGGVLDDDERQRTLLQFFGPTVDDFSSPHYDRYGFARGDIDGWIGHTGNGDGFQALVMFDPTSGRSVAIVLNATTDDPGLLTSIFERVRNLG